MGKDSSGDSAANQAATAQTRLAQQLIGETTPLRQNLISDAAGFVSGGRDVTSLPEFAAFKGSAESGFNRAKDNIIANTPEGGPLIAALTQLEGQRAGNQAGFTGALASDEIQRALQLATFGAAQGTAGLGNAGAVQASRAGSQSAENAAKTNFWADVLVG